MIERPKRKGGDWESGEQWVGGFRERERERETSALGFVERERMRESHWAFYKSDMWRERVREPLGCMHLNT